MPRYYHSGPAQPIARPLVRWARRLALLAGGSLVVAVVPALREPVQEGVAIFLLLALVFWPLVMALVLLLPVFLFALALRPPARRPARRVADFAYLNPLEILLGLVAAAVACLCYGLHECSQWVWRQRKPTTRQPRE